jgi:tetratricopeptide (TPR) repeat protein/transcriptional regulator with XRE-family HTH domain
MAIPTFGELLTRYMRRSGINDSELARAIGVQRQTIFRWKEGLVARPRVREDVLTLAHKLRLTPSERDQMLLAAGFQPESLPVEVDEHDQPTKSEELVTKPTAESASPTKGHPLTSVLLPRVDEPPAVSWPSNQETTPLAGPRPIPTRWQWPSWLVALLVTLIIVTLLVTQPLIWLNPPTPTPGVTATPSPTVTAKPYPIAAPGQIMILVTQFTSFTGDQQFNIAGRIRNELNQELMATKMPSATVAIWPDVITTQAEADQSLAAADAALIIWGEYDSGRVLANLTLSDKHLSQSVDFSLTSADDLVATINSAVPAEVRMLALLSMGSLYPLDTFYAEAAKTYKAALALNPTQQNTRALLNFYIGYAVSQGGKLNDLEQAIGYYTQAIALNPQLYTALYNRGTLWYHRSLLLPAGSDEIGQSLDAAIADLNQTLLIAPDYANAYLNRGISYYERNQSGDQGRAILDFNKVIQLRPRDDRGYYHRSLARIRAGGQEDWAGDLANTLVIRRSYAPAYVALCWGYALDQQAELALPNCDKAVALGDVGASYDARGIALAMQGQYEQAAIALQRYLTWLKTLPQPHAYARLRGPQVEQWIAALQGGENPFDPATLATLR